jgi:SRSO17 transposase
MIQEIQALGFVIERVLADSLYGESAAVISRLEKLNLPYIVAIRSNHGVLMTKGQRVGYNRWRAYGQPLSKHPAERRYIREIIFGHRRKVRYYQITKGSTDNNPDKADGWFIMTNLTGEILLSIATQYSLRMWIEYGFKQVKHELGWHDYRLTDDNSIGRWWEIVFSAYLLVSLHADQFKHREKHVSATIEATSNAFLFRQHPYWEPGATWKSALNNLRLLLQPYWCWGWLESWLQIFAVPGLNRGLHQVMNWMDTFNILPIPDQNAA